MNREIRSVLITLLIVLLAVSIVSAQSGGNYDLSWNTQDGGGVFFTNGGNYALGGSIGQAEAGVVMSGGSYTLQGGFLSGFIARYKTMLPAIVR